GILRCPVVRPCHLSFFFQAEDGIRDRNVTGVQTCALPIYNAVIPGALLSLVAGLVILAVASAPWHFIIAAFLGGFGHGAALPGLQTAGIKRTTADRVQIATSTHYLALDSGFAIGPVMLRVS